MTNPVPRLTGLFGLAVTGALAYLVVTDSLSLPDAATRAGITLVAVLVTRRVARSGMSVLASSLERQQRPAPTRRSSDR